MLATIPPLEERAALRASWSSHEPPEPPVNAGRTRPSEEARAQGPDPATSAFEGDLARAVLQASLDPMVVIDGHGKVLLASDSIESVFGWRPEEFVGQNVSVLMVEPYRSEHDQYLARYRRTGEINILGRTREFPVRHKDGTQLICELSVARVQLPGRKEPVFIGGLRDITERRRAERAEKNMLRALATVGESAALLAHEIKNPITAVNLALRAVATQLGEDHQGVLEDLVSRMQRLESLMRRTLTIARPLKLDPSVLDADETIARCIRALRPEIVKRGVEVEPRPCERPLRFPADRQLLDEVLTNLLKNAIEVVEPGGHVRLAARPLDGDWLEFEVEDDGPGIPPEQAARLFQPFSSDKQGGTGLGLAFSRKVVQEHGGEILVDRGALGGARFRVRLPIDGRS